MGTGTVDTFAAQGERKMYKQRDLLVFLEAQGELFKKGGTLGYYVLWAESIRGPIKLPIVQEDTISDRENEAAVRPDETRIVEDSNEDSRYENLVLAVLPNDESARKMLSGAIAVRDLLRAEAEKQRINKLLQ